MTASPYASDAKIAAAVAAIGATLVANNEQTLLQQILVAVATASGGGGGGGVAWGAITGTLSAQTDLQAALDLKANLTANTFSASQTLSAGRVIFGADASLGYDSGNGSISVRNAANSAYLRLDADILFGVNIVASNAQVFASGGGIIGSPSFLGNGGGIQAVDTGYIGFSSTSSISGTPDVLLRRGGAAVISMGTTHPTTPTAQTIKAHNVTTGIGADLILSGGAGSTADGEVSFGVYTAGVIVPDGWIRIKSKSGLFLRIPAYLEP